MKKVINVLGITLAISAGVILLLLILPLVLVISTHAYFQEKEIEKHYRKYLLELEGKNFFCYNNRRKSEEYIEKEVLPLLCEEIEVIYLNGKVPQTKYHQAYISRALYQLKHYSKFPHLMKVRNGQIIDLSINNELHNAIHYQQPAALLLKTMKEFFELDKEEKNAA